MRDLSKPLAPTFGDPKKKIKPASANPQVGKRIAADGHKGFRPNVYERKNKKHSAVLRESFNSKGVVGGLKKVLTRPEPKNSMWYNFPSYFKGKTKKAKKTSTMHKTRNPKPGPYQY